MKAKSNVIHIYNMSQANFYMYKGCRCLWTGRHDGTGNVYWVFDKKECYEAYLEWISRVPYTKFP